MTDRGDRTTDSGRPAAAGPRGAADAPTTSGAKRRRRLGLASLALFVPVVVALARRRRPPLPWDLRD